MKTAIEDWIIAGAGTKTRKALDQWQLDMMKNTVLYARNRSAYYRNSLAGADMAADSMEALLHTIPLLDWQDIRENPLALVCCSQSDINRVVTLKTSGTTGMPKRVFFTGADQERTIDFFSVGMKDIAAQADPVAILMPGEKPGSIGDLLAQGLQKNGTSWKKIGSVHHIEDVYKQLIGCRAIVGIPTQALALAKYHETYGKGGLHIHSVLLSADVVSDVVKKEIGRIWGCPVYTHYGMTETGLGGAVECKSLAGCHIREADLFVEIIDPKTGKRQKDGNQGEIVITTFHRQAMPFIRYRTGDLGFIAAGICPCGSFIKRLAPVGGRMSDMGPVRPGQAPVDLLRMIDNIVLKWENVVDYDFTGDGTGFDMELFCIGQPDANGILRELGEKGFSLEGSKLRYSVVQGFQSDGMKKRGVGKWRQEQ